jgi:hypothetical protein
MSHMSVLSRVDEMARLAERLSALEDRDEIGQLAARYCFVIDDRDVEALGRCFTRDGRFRSADGKMDARGREAVIEQFHGRYAVLGLSNHVGHHHVIELDPDDPDHASGTLSSHAEVVRTGKVLVCALRYEDEYRREDGCWRFADRLLRFLYYLAPEDYARCLRERNRNHAYLEPLPADLPEDLESYQAYYRECPPAT